MNSAADIEQTYIHDSIIRGVFFDNDDVLYRAPENDKDYHRAAAVAAVQEQLDELSDKRVNALIDKAQEKGKGSLDIIVERFNADAQQMREDHYKHLIELTKEFPGFFDHDESAYGEIAKLRIAGINTHIITHGNAQWTAYTTSQNERSLSDFFKDSRNYTTKDEMPDHSGKGSPAIYERALDKMDVDLYQENRGHEFAMVEDTMSNLKAAKELGMMTIFINRKSIPDKDVADYVDVVVDTSNEAVQAVIQSNAYLESRFELSALDV